MRDVISPALVLLLIVGLVVYAYRTRRRNEPLPDYGIFLCLPLRQPIELDCLELISRFRARWGAQVGCGENPRWGDPQKAMRGYVVTDGQNNLVLTVSARPLDAQLTELALAANWHLSTPDEAQRATLRGHQAFVLLRYATGSEEPLVRVRFTAQLLVTLLDLLDEATGYVNVRGQLYVPRETLEANPPGDPLEPAGLFLLFANTQFVEQDAGHWIHTHGLEQFGLPDVELRTAEGDDTRQYWETVAGAAAYMIERGPILKPGDTTELAGGGAIYRIQQARGERDHPYGPYGALELVRQ